MDDIVSIPTLEPLEKASITFTGTTITVLFRDRDRISSQLKQMMSVQMGRPVLFVFQTKDSIKHEWWTDGLLYNPLGAAMMQSSDTGTTESHHRPDGQLGCDYGPAFVAHQYGQQYVEKWISDNARFHRDDGGAAITEIDYETGDSSKIKRREMGWYRNGKFYRDSWSIQIDFCGEETFEAIPPMGLLRTLKLQERELRWYNEDGDLHRLDGPAVIKFTGLLEIEKNGKMAGWQWEDWRGDWHIHGKGIPFGSILHWSKENHIPMWNEPCYDRSSFRDEAGEFCFLTDFAGV